MNKLLNYTHYTIKYENIYKQNLIPLKLIYISTYCVDNLEIILNMMLIITLFTNLLFFIFINYFTNYKA